MPLPDSISIDANWLSGAIIWLSGLIVTMGAFIRSLLMRVLDEAREERKEAREERQARMRTEEQYDRLHATVVEELRRHKP